MAIKMNWGSALAEGLLGGIAGYAGEIGAEHKQARANEQAQQMEKMKADAALATKKAGMHLSHPEYHTVKETDDNGVAQDVSYKDTFNATGGDDGAGGWDSVKIGTAPSAVKAPEIRNIIDGPNEYTASIGPDGTPTPLGSPGSRRAPLADPMAGLNAFAARAQITEDSRARSAAAADDAKSTREQAGLDAKAKRQADAQTATDMRNFYKNVDTQPGLLQQYGIEADDPAAASKYKRFTTASNYQNAGVDAPTRATANTQGSGPTPSPGPLTEQNAPMPAAQGKPSMQSILADATAAVKRGAPQAAVEARMKQLMQKYGYQPQDAGQ